HQACFSSEDRYTVPTYTVPKEVDSVINHRMLGKNQIFAGVSGGVRVDPGRLLADHTVSTQNPKDVAYQYEIAMPPQNVEHWWWD
ncbi:MAG: hypothetical protein N2C12_15440, partial [Planctomycetales bacterium]